MGFSRAEFAIAMPMNDAMQASKDRSPWRSRSHPNSASERAIYFEEGGFGILYSPLLTNHPGEPESVSGATAQQFARRCRSTMACRSGAALEAQLTFPIQVASPGCVDPR